MTDAATLRGARIQQMAGTISFKNWPFLVLLAAIGLVRPSTKPCTVKESQRSSDICILSGAVKNAKAMGSTELDEVILEDSTGSRSIYFDPTKLSLNGRTSARVTGREVEERGSGARRFVAESVE